MFVECRHCSQWIWFDEPAELGGKNCSRCGKWVDITPEEQLIGVAPPSGRPRNRWPAFLTGLALLLLLALLLWLWHGIRGGGGSDGVSTELGGAGAAGSPYAQNGKSGGGTNSSSPVAPSTATANTNLDTPADPLKDASATNLSEISGTMTTYLPPDAVAAAGAGRHGMFGGGRGTRFVFVLDRSSSMRFQEKFVAVVADLKAKLRLLTPQHSFYIILFNTGADAMPASGLQPATPASMGAMLQWLDAQTCQGGTDPVEAMTKAIALRPHTIWLLSDGEFSQVAVDRITAANRGARICINTIAFYREAETLLRVAQENEGSYLYVAPPPGMPGFGPSRPSLPRMRP